MSVAASPSAASAPLQQAALPPPRHRRSPLCSSSGSSTPRRSTRCRSSPQPPGASAVQPLAQAAQAACDPANERDLLGQTPLMRAALKGNAASTQQLLLNGADANARDSWGTSALHLAAGRGHATVVRALLQHGAEVDVADSGGRTALMAAALAGAYSHMVNIALARSLGFSSAGAFESARALVAAGADVGATDEAGFTPLARLAQAPLFDSYSADTARLLLAAGADGGPALEAALREENSPALEVLIGAGVDATPLLAERLEFTRVHRRSADDVLLLLRAGAPLDGLPLGLKQYAVELALRSR